MRRSLAILLTPLLLLLGCGDSGRTPLTPELQPATALSGTSDLTGVLEFVTLPDLSGTRRAERFITAASGGSVELNGFRIDVPAGALPYDAVVSIQLPTDLERSQRVLAEFGPHGIQFNQPVTITFPLVGVSVPTAGVEVARWENGGWTSLEGSVAPNGASVSSTTPHFSEYSARSKEMVAGG
jgi:hypothetical protein